jgi:hypothetical protein
MLAGVAFGLYAELVGGYGQRWQRDAQKPPSEPPVGMNRSDMAFWRRFLLPDFINVLLLVVWLLIMTQN